MEVTSVVFLPVFTANGRTPQSYKPWKSPEGKTRSECGRIQAKTQLELSVHWGRKLLILVPKKGKRVEIVKGGVHLHGQKEMSLWAVCVKKRNK